MNNLKPNLVKLATETDDNDDAIGDILKANDQCERIVNQYKSIFDNDSSLLKIPDNDVNLVNLSSPASSLLEDSHKNNSNQLSNYDPLKELEDLFSKPTSTTFQSQKNDLLNEIYENNNNNTNQKSFDMKMNNLASVIQPLTSNSVNATQFLNQNTKQNKNISETSRILN